MNLKSKFSFKSVDEILPEYPRPQLERDSYITLNGVWKYAITESTSAPSEYDGDIIVPFSPESPLSGVERTLMPNEYLWYKRTFTLDEDFIIDRVILNFGAVDRHAVVYINDKEVCRHSGGYTPFSADITAALTDGENIITVRVKDETDKKDTGGRGKQSFQRGGIWYTPQSGIWQTVWLESVPENYIKSLRITPDFDKGRVEIYIESDKKVISTLSLEGKTYGFASNGTVGVTLKDFIPWTPESPYLYYFTITMGKDTVKSYFAMRKVSLGEVDGKTRILLNNRPYFQFGLLDQGYYCDGLYTPQSDEAMIYDIELAKKSGFNMLRKHIKIEPMRWYYHCDRLGMIVWQDMVNGGDKYKFTTITLPLFTGKHANDSSYAKFARLSPEGRAAYYSELSETVNLLYNTPSVLVYTAFNEGWGQFDSQKALERIKALDSTRLVDVASGWHDKGYGDICSRHVYFRKYKYSPDKHKRAVVLSEFGGYSLRIDEHSMSSKKFGYRDYKDKEKLSNAVIALFKDVIATAKKHSLSAFVYTQLSDVEDEVNGLVTYDRQLIKLDIQRINDLFHSSGLNDKNDK